ncbi:IS110 family transposase [Catenulispora sp. NF23]|uniref:IS110 family transposase n=1 Tax=Catenulispora pinistramenti TaxID=2705254 RepID=A0ABS5L8P7_9ACTN|nr:IS110 family transposase [Catenulispora pinistramenti]MBS2536849.1 IS110 family transposase [Catenulispora pinistramenti]MBS2554722.1 IS110 family transposase [Catenulispora pinistramenti]
MNEDGEVVELFADEERLARVAAIDVGKNSAMVCTRLPGRGSRRVQKTFPVGATTAAITELAGQLVAQQVELVVMESTSDYWRPFFYLLEDQGLRCWLVNARDVKNVPSRPKTDKLDAIWLAKLAERGMLRPSFVPPPQIRQLRDFTRLRTTLVAERTRHRNQIEKVLQDACIKLSDKKDGATDIFGVSGRAMLEALAAGQRDPETLAQLARGRMRAKIPKLIQALTGRFTDHHADLITTLLDLHDHVDTHITTLDAKIAAAIAQIDPTPPPDNEHPHRMPLFARLQEIPGVGPSCAQTIIAEVGVDPSVFPTGGHLASWAKLTPRTIQSGAKNTHGPTGKGNGWLKGALGQAANNASGTKTFLGARFRRIVKHAPAKKAIIAVARNILEIAWILICDPDARYQDLGPDWHQRHLNRNRKTRQAVRELEHLGYTVTLTEAA